MSGVRIVDIRPKGVYITVELEKKVAESVVNYLEASKALMSKIDFGSDYEHGVSEFFDALQRATKEVESWS